MKFVRNREELEMQIVTTHQSGKSIHALTKEFKISRNTVRKILRNNETRRNDGHCVVVPKKNFKPSILDPFMPEIEKLLAAYPDITGQRMFESLREAGYTGGITILRERLAKLRSHPKKEPVIRFETEPGEQGQMDWSPYTINFRQGGRTDVQCFSYMLGYSRRHYIDFTPNRQFFTLIRRHQDAFEYFGGVPEHCLYDGEKTILLRWEAGCPVFNPAFIAFITHYRCRPVACRPRRPQTKGKVEAPFKYIENNFLNARTFDDLEDLRAQSRWWLANCSDVHRHRTTGFTPIDLFTKEEQSALQPLPNHPYDSAEVALRVCRSDGVVEFDGNFYSVPVNYVGDILSVRATEDEVTVYSPDIQQIASHERLEKSRGKVMEAPEHGRKGKKLHGLESVIDTFLALGESAQAFLVGLKEKHPTRCGYHARMILNMKERFHCLDIEKALTHALSYYAFDADAVKRILTARATPRTLESIQSRHAVDRISKTLPDIRQRPLNEYSQLFTSYNKDNSHD
jgi:transposase